MKIQLTSVGKKFNRDWIFKNITTTLSSKSSYAITGPNGSGKSTLLKIISGFMLPTEGEIGYYKDNIGINVEDFYQFIDFSAPYVELIEEMTLKEFLRFHFSFKKLGDNVDIDDLPGLMFLEKETDKYLLNFNDRLLLEELGFITSNDLQLPVRNDSWHRCTEWSFVQQLVHFGLRLAHSLRTGDRLHRVLYAQRFHL